MLDMRSGRGGARERTVRDISDRAAFARGMGGGMAGEEFNDCS